MSGGEIRIAVENIPSGLAHDLKVSNNRILGAGVPIKRGAVKILDIIRDPAGRLQHVGKIFEGPLSVSTHTGAASASTLSRNVPLSPPSVIT
jgi:hypothetical protein